MLKSGGLGLDLAGVLSVDLLTQGSPETGASQESVNSASVADHGDHVDATDSG